MMRSMKLLTCKRLRFYGELKRLGWYKNGARVRIQEIRKKIQEAGKKI